MKRKLTINFDMDAALLKAADGYAEAAAGHYRTLVSESIPYTGWVSYVNRLKTADIAEINSVATEIRAKCSVFVVIGIGGSYLGAKAAIEYISASFGSYGSKGKIGTPQVLFAGFNLSGTYHNNLLNSIRDEDICICHISKSGGTTEPSIAFLTLRKLLIEKYGETEANARTYAVTDRDGGSLRSEAKEKGYRSLYIPGDIGGRYSVLTPVGLLPIAVAGIDIAEIVNGARAGTEPDTVAQSKRLACVRKSIQDIGKTVEVIGFFEPSAEAFIQWLLQLYGESEGKDGKGMLPVGAGLSRDLHSLGQFFQEGNQIFCETLLWVENPPADIILDEEGGFYAGRHMTEVNTAVKSGMIAAHRNVEIPITTLNIPDFSPFSFGLLVQFFELTCGITGLLMGVDPFTQPGVEAYKKEMKTYLSK
ncbi:MAG: glucose-6-phosphate isomerase [Clostridiales Family XIII bacterium]|jgi:glucose-6-phosphate isomerase|nr:glucose-6-phosphate isomerase [Clostridiales Family XIII bacterium]